MWYGRNRARGLPFSLLPWHRGPGSSLGFVYGAESERCGMVNLDRERVC